MQVFVVDKGIAYRRSSEGAPLAAMHVASIIEHQLEPLRADMEAQEAVVLFDMDTEEATVTHCTKELGEAVLRNLREE